MNVYQNARLPPRGRQQLVDYVLKRGAKFRKAGRAFGVGTKTVRRWVSAFSQRRA